ncbi:hypothetical protein DOI34_25400, partial [Salmonella enterica subsp. enterica serovar Virchow]|nr:hypothetical protein [Salmonella enterica subsp. enterica serovar Virchow]
SQPLILFPEFPRPSYADFVLAALAGAGVRLCGEIYAMDLHTALAMVGVGEGVCVVPASVGSASRGGIDYRPTLNLDARTWLSVNHRVDNQSTHVANFVKHALSASRSVRAETAQPDTAGRSSLDKSAA